MIGLELLLGFCLHQDVSSPTWNGEISTLLERNCASCHQPGGVAPFSLLKYSEVAPRGRFLVSVVNQGLMPPWLPGDDGLRLVHSRRLSETERSSLETWVGADMPIGEGTPRSLVPPKDRPIRIDLSRNTMLEYRLPEETPEAYHRGEMDRHAFRIILGNREPLRVQAFRIKSSAPQSVRVATLLADDEGKARWLDGEDPLPGWRTSSDLAYRPGGAHGVTLLGGGPLRLPTGYHWSYPPLSEISLGLHYRPTGREERLKEQVEFELVPETAESRPLRWLPAAVMAVELAPGEVEKQASPPLTLPFAVDLVAVTPRALEICTSTSTRAVLPDGSEVRILQIDDWDHHRRETYVLERPLRLPAGTVIESEWALDNTAENPRNPDDPPISVSRRQRAGILLTLLHVAAASEKDDDRLKIIGQERISSQQRLPSISED